MFGKEPSSEINPDEVVAIGAATAPFAAAGGPTYQADLSVAPWTGAYKGDGIYSRDQWPGTDQTRLLSVDAGNAVNFKVRILDESKGTGAVTRVLLDASDGVDVREPRNLIQNPIVEVAELRPNRR